MSRIRQLGKDSVVYGLGGILAKSIAFFTLPIYTRIFTPSDYGTIEMLTVISGILGSILVTGMDSAQSMFFFKHKDEGKEAQASMVSSILQWKLIFGSCIVLLSTLLAPVLNMALFEGRLSLTHFAIAFFGSLFAQVMLQSAELMRLLYRPWAYIAITLSKSVLAAVMILMFVLIFDQGILGYFLGAGCASILIAVFGWSRATDYLKLGKFHFNWWPKLLRFGAPLVPAALALYFMGTTDRWFIQYFHGPHMLGLFAVGAKFSMLMLLAVETFRKAWWPIAMDAMHSEDGPETFRKIARLYVGFGSASVVVLSFVSPWLLKWFTAPAYHGVWPVVCILAWQAFFYGFFLIASAGIWKAEKTYLNLPLSVGMALVGIALNWLFVPSFGMMGAATATVISYFIWVVLAVLISETLWKVEFNLGIMVLQLILGLCFVAGYTLYGDGNILVSLVSGAAVLAIILYVTLDKETKDILLSRFTKSS